MKVFENRIRALSRVHRSVCAVLLPGYRQLPSGELAYAPNMIQAAVVTSKDGGVRDFWSPLIKMKFQVNRYEDAGWFSSGEMIEIN